MWGFLGFLLLFVLLIISIGVSILRYVLRALFGWNGRSTWQTQQQNTRQQQASSYSDQTEEADSFRSSRSSQQPHPSGRRKIFEADEGEYVDFEEVK